MIASNFIILLSASLVFSETRPKEQREMENSVEFWKKNGQIFLESKLQQKLNNNKARNVIMFVGDGLGFPTIAATRSYMGGIEKPHVIDKFPHFGLCKPYCLDRQTADSACTATAYLHGLKSNYKTIGVNSNVKASQCHVDADDHTESFASWAVKAGKGIGIVTTTRITHATPAGVYAHTSNRDWENNQHVQDGCKTAENIKLDDVGLQLIHGDVGKSLKVILGGGRRNLLNTTMVDDEGFAGHRTDGRNLIEEWLEFKSDKGNAKYIWHKQQLDEVDFEKTDYLMGLFESDHCLYNLDRTNNKLQAQEPSLTEMTVAAIKMLQKEKEGFFLFVEGGMIDQAIHANNAIRAFEDTAEFIRAIEAALQATDTADTLIVVTSDHSQAMTFGGHPKRDADILETAGKSDMDGLPLLSLSFSTGSGYSLHFANESGSRMNLTNVNTRHPEFLQYSTFPMLLSKHSGEDVGVYASGPRSHLFSGSYEQNVIPIVMAYAAEVGPYQKKKEASSSAVNGLQTAGVLLVFMGVVGSVLCNFYIHSQLP